ncbi:MAG: hypothetical protein WBD31_16040, partial [Rubripirellula sp.]
APGTSDSDYSDSDYSDSDYSDSDYSDSDYSDSDYSDSDYSDSDYSGSDYSGSDGSGSDYSDSDGSGSEEEMAFESCSLPLGPFEQGDWYGSDLGGMFESEYYDVSCDPRLSPYTVSEQNLLGNTSETTIEFDFNLDGIADERSVFAGDLTFSRPIRNLGRGYHTVQVRTQKWDEKYGGMIASAWVQHTFYSEGLASPSVESLALVNSPNTSNSADEFYFAGTSEGVTHDPTISGVLRNIRPSLTNLQVEIDTNGDGVVDDKMFVDHNGHFVYVPTDLSPGYTTIAVRSSAFDKTSATTEHGNWSYISFNFVPSQAPEIMDFGLLVDDGISAFDGITTQATLMGQLTAFHTRNVKVLLDLNGDGIADAIVNPQANGRFMYRAAGLTPGQYQFSAWTSSPNHYKGTADRSVPVTFSSTLEEAEPDSPLIVDLRLKNDTGNDTTDHFTTDPTLLGTLTGVDYVANQLIEFDFDQDGVPDDETTTDAAGRFEYTPPFDSGAFTVAVRGLVYDFVEGGQNELLYGEWTTISFTRVNVDVASTTVIVQQLLSDSGTPGDLRTENPIVIGTVTDDVVTDGSSAIVIEVDTNQDGLPDQTVFADDDGRFSFDPRPLDFGAVTVATRTVGFDIGNSLKTYGEWSSFSFTYEDQVDEAPRVSNTVFSSQLVTDGDAPFFSGRLTSQQDVENLRVEIDTNSDGVADFQGTTDQLGRFSIPLKGLADGTTSIDVRAKSIHPHTKEVLVSDWSSNAISFNLSSQPAATITQESGTPNQLKGTVSKAPLGRAMIVEFDEDNDGAVDASILVGADLTWTFSPTDVYDQSGGINARIRDTLVGGRTLIGDWTSLSVESDEGQGMGGSPEDEDEGEEPNGGNGGGENGEEDSGEESEAVDPQQERQDKIDDATDQATRDDSEADSELADAIIQANSEQDAAVATAQAEHQERVALAEEDFVEAQRQAALVFSVTQDGVNGDTSSFHFEPFQWPDAPRIESPQIPDDADQATPPRTQPTYHGEAFDPEKDPLYQAAVNEANTRFNTLQSDAKETRIANDKLAYDEYLEEVNSRRSIDANDRQDASDTFNDELATPTQTDIDAATTAYQNARQSAYDEYNSAIEGARQQRDDDVSAARDASQAERTAANNEYQGQVDSARQDYYAVLNQDPSPSSDERASALLQYQTIAHNAGKVRDQRLAVASHVEASAIISANKAYQEAFAGPRKILADKIRAARKIYEKAVDDFNKESREREIAAQATRDVSLENIGADTDKAIADAKKTLALKRSTNARQETIAIEEARSQQWVDLADARKVAAYREHSVRSTAWSQYQWSVAINESDYARSLQIAHNLHTSDVTEAQKVRDDAEAEAEHKRAYDIANHRQSSAPGNASREKDYKLDQSDAQHQADKRRTIARDELAQKMAEAADILARKGIEAGFVYATTLADAQLAYSSATISARRLFLGVPPATLASAGAERTIAGNNASRTWRLAQLNDGAAAAQSARDAYKAYSTEIDDLEAELADKNADDLKAYRDLMVNSDQGNLVVLVGIEVVYEKALITAYAEYVEDVAPADKTYDDSSVQYVGVQNVSDATALKQFYIDESTTYQAAMNQWNNELGNQWSAMHVRQAAIEVTWAARAGNAEFEYATAIRDQNLQRQRALSTIYRDNRISTAGFYKVEHHAFADQKLTYVTTIAGPQRTFALEQNEIDHEGDQKRRDREKEQRDKQRNFLAEHAADVATAENDYTIAMINANTDYSNDSVNATAGLHGAAGTSLEAHNAEDGISYEEHRGNIATAVGEYNQAMADATDSYNDAGSAANETVRAARAELIVRFRENSILNQPAMMQARKSAEEQSLVEATGVNEKELAQQVLNATITLATNRGIAEKAYAANVNNLELVAAPQRSTIENTHSYQSAVKLGQYNRKQLIAEAGAREDRIASRGLYEVAMYNHYAGLTGVLGANDPLMQALSEVATADANWAENIRIARDLYEDAISIAMLKQFDAINGADLEQIDRANAADHIYVQATTPESVAHAIKYAQAETDLAVSNTIEEAKFVKQEIDAKADYDSILAALLAARDASLAAGLTTFAEESSEALEGALEDDGDDGLNTNATGPSWVDRVWTDLNPDNYYFGASDLYYGGYGGYGGYYGYYGLDYYSTGVGYGFGNFGYGYGYGYSGFNSFGYGLAGYGYGGSSFGYGGWGYGGGYANGGWGYGGWNAGGYFGFGGWGYGWNYLSALSADASNSLQTDMDAATDQLQSTSNAAHKTFIQESMAADIRRLTAVAEAQVTLTAAIGTSNVTYATTLNTADSTLDGVNGPATIARATQHASALRTREDKVAEASEELVTDQATANGAFSLDVKNEAFGRAYDTAAAKAGYIVSLANDRATNLSAMADDNDSPNFQFAAAYAMANANWLADVTSAFKTYSGEAALANATLDYNMTLHRGLRDRNRAAATLVYDKVESQEVETLSVQSITKTVQHASDTLPLANTRRLDDATLTANLENDQQVAQKDYDIDRAEAGKTHALDRIDEEIAAGPNDGMNQEPSDIYDQSTKAYNESMADAALDFATDTAQAKLTWHQQDATSKATYTTSRAPLDHAFSTDNIDLQDAYQRTIIAAQHTRETYLISADRAFFRNETAAENIRRTKLTDAEIDLRNVKETARIDAHEAINGQMNLLWTSYLVTAAHVQKDAWNTTRTRVASLTNDRNAAELLYTNTTSSAYAARENTIAAEVKQRDLNRLSARTTAATAKSDAHRDFHLNLAGPTGDYTHDIADVQYSYEVAMAQAQRDFVFNDDAAQRTTDLQTAQQDRTSNLETHEGTWRTAFVTEQADLYLDQATADRDLTLTTLAESLAQTIATNNAWRDYRNDETGAYLTSATQWANLDSAFLQAEAAELAAAAHDRRHSGMWALYDAQVLAARSTQMVEDVNPANAILQATAQHDRETVDANEYTRSKNAKATNRERVGSETARADYGEEYYLSTQHGSSDTADVQLPAAAELPDQNLDTPATIKLIKRGEFDEVFWAKAVDDVVNRIDDWSASVWDGYVQNGQSNDSDLSDVATLQTADRDASGTLISQIVAVSDSVVQAPVGDPISDDRSGVPAVLAPDQESSIPVESPKLKDLEQADQLPKDALQRLNELLVDGDSSPAHNTGRSPLDSLDPHKASTTELVEWTIRLKEATERIEAAALQVASEFVIEDRNAFYYGVAK